MNYYFYFIFYSFGGWLLENTYNMVKNGVFLKKNYLKLPLKPMYGFAPVLLLLISEYFDQWEIILFLCFVIPSLIEYLTGFFLEKYTARRWWDYENERFNLNKHICLRFSIYWGFLCIGLLQFLHPIVAFCYGLFTPICNELAILFTFPFSIDVVITLLNTFWFKRYQMEASNKPSP